MTFLRKRGNNNNKTILRAVVDILTIIGKIKLLSKQIRLAKEIHLRKVNYIR